MSLLVVGSIALDSIFTPFGETADALGGSAVYFSVAGSLLHPVQVVGVIGRDYPVPELERLAPRGIDWSGVERADGESFRWKGKYSYDLQSRETLETRLGVFADFQPKLPESYKTAPYLLLGNIQPSLQQQVRGQMNGVRFAGGDTMNYWITGFRDELLATIRNWDFLLINDSEARLLSGETNLRRAASAILDMGPNTLVIKRGEYGAILFRRDRHFMVPGYLLETVFDPTGAGDCFAGGFVGYLAERGFDLQAGHIDGNELSRAVIYGSVMGSFCCEKFGVDRFRTLTRDDIEARFAEFREFTTF